MADTPLQSLLARHNAVGDEDGCVLHYGNPVDELRALRHGAVVALRNDFGLLQITGPDAGEFLHRLTANDVKSLPPNSGHANLFLNAKGRILADFRLFRLAQTGPLESDGAPAYLAVPVQPCAQPLAALLEKYHFSEKLTVTDRRAADAPLTIVGVYGKSARATLAAALAGGELPGKPHQILPYTAAATGATGWLTALPAADYAADGFEFILPTVAAVELFSALTRANLSPIGLAALGAASLEAGRPRFGADYDDQTLPPEAGLTHAYSLKKGCYIGQEIMARIQTYGHVNKQITALKLHGDAPVPRNADVLDGDAKVGSITSSIFSPTIHQPIALAYVNLKHRETGKQLAVQADATTRIPAEIIAGSFV